MCRICLKTPCHYQCPNYLPPKARHYCSICDDGIYENEDYVVNENMEYAHWDCFQGMRDLVEWLGYEVKTMGSNDEY